MAKSKKTEDAKTETEDKGYKPELDVVVAEYDLTPQLAEGKILVRVMQYNGGAKKFGFVYSGKNGRTRAQNRIPTEVAKLLPLAIEQFEKDGVL